jgi:hypothetical protein
MQSLREAERTPENADRVRDLTGRIEEDRRKFEKTAGSSSAQQQSESIMANPKKAR